LGIEPASWTDDGKPSWASLQLETLVVPPGLPSDLGQLLSEASRLSHFTSNYCQGWLEAVGHDGRLHPDFKQWGTVTGRLSSSGPNVQNFDDMAEAWMEEDPASDRVIMYYDLSQAEYRVFGHYTGAAILMDAYAQNVDTDFHAWLADKMGVSRQFAKTMNFSFIYGMGKKKLLKTLSALLSVAISHGDPRMLTKMRLMIISGSAAAKAGELLSSSETAAASEQIYNMYHRTLPEIRKFQQRVANLCRARGWLKNFYGRVYRIAADRAYVGVNAVVQGTVGDYMKERSAELFERTRDLDAHMIDEIHDASIWSVKRSDALEFHNRAHPIFETSRFRIPMRADAKISAASWSQMVKIKRNPTQADLDAALLASKAKPIMTWDERESRKYEGTSTKGHGI
jgi:DNA polymerase I-like protein with 3'-5' exonuclease and polymerase domains